MIQKKIRHNDVKSIRRNRGADLQKHFLNM